MYKNIIDGNWYAPLHYLQDRARVVEAEHMQTSSSAGDWDGYFIERYKKSYRLTFFSQENRWPRGGFSLYIGQGFKFDHRPTAQEVVEFYQAVCS